MTHGSQSNPCNPTCGGLTLEQVLERAQECCAANEAGIEALESGVLAATPEFASWARVNEWNRFTETSISGQDGNPPDNNLILSVSGDGSGVATNDGGSHGNDRRIYLFSDGPQNLSDVEVRASFNLTIGGNVQFGIAARASTTVAVVPWQNIIFGGASAMLHGIWEYAGNALLNTNQMNSTPMQLYNILSAEGDGATVTVQTREPHLLRISEFVFIDFGPFSGNQIVTSVAPDRFTFDDAAVFSTTDGTWGKTNQVNPSDKWRNVAVRVVDNWMNVKQWLPFEPEPRWGDPLRTVTSFFPDELEASGNPPPTSGQAGILLNHFGDSNPSKEIFVRDFEVRAL